MGTSVEDTVFPHSHRNLKYDNSILFILVEQNVLFKISVQTEVFD